MSSSQLPMAHFGKDNSNCRIWSYLSVKLSPDRTQGASADRLPTLRPSQVLFSIFLFSHLRPSSPVHQTFPIAIEHFPCFPTYYLRCDGCISALGIDVSSGERRFIRLQHEVAELRSAVDAKFKEMTEKARDDDKRPEKSSWCTALVTHHAFFYSSYY